jgi:hypothetical protein
MKCQQCEPYDESLWTGTCTICVTSALRQNYASGSVVVHFSFKRIAFLLFFRVNIYCGSCLHSLI